MIHKLSCSCSHKAVGIENQFRCVLGLRISHTGKFIFEIGIDLKITVFIQWKLWNFLGGRL